MNYIIIISLVIVIVLVILYSDKAIISEKLKRFQDRPKLSCQEFYELYFANSSVEINAVILVDKLLKDSIGISIGQCIPQDRFSDKLADVKMFPDGALLKLEEAIQNLAGDNNFVITKYPDMIGEFVELIHAITTKNS